MYKRILAPIDGSEASGRGLKEAVALARDQGAQLRLLYVIDASMITVDPTAFAGYDKLLDALRDGGRKTLQRGAALAAEQGVPVESVLLETADQRVAPTIVAEIGKQGCDLVVMGTHGRRGLSHLMLGSDAEAVIKSSPVPVLVVRP